MVQVTPHHHKGYQIFKTKVSPNPPMLTYTQYFNIHFLDNINIFFFLKKKHSVLPTTITGDAIQWTGVKAPLHLNVPDIGIVYEGHSRALLYTPCEVPPDDQPLAP